MTQPALAPPLEAAEVKFCALNLKGVTLNGVFEGYASLFNREDLARDVVLPGAFRECLARRGAAGVRMLFQHDPNQPIGTWERLYEDARGLYARGRLATEVGKAREVEALMRAGALDGLSIGFRTIKGVRDKRTGLRRLEKIDLWEVSVVTFPLLTEARVASVKSRPFAGRTPRPSELERSFLARAGGGLPSERRLRSQMRQAAELLLKSIR